MHCCIFLLHWQPVAMAVAVCVPPLLRYLFGLSCPEAQRGQEIVLHLSPVG